MEEFFNDLGHTLAGYSPYEPSRKCDELATAIAMIAVGILTIPFPIVGLPIFLGGTLKLLRLPALFISVRVRQPRMRPSVYSYLTLSLTIGRHHGV